MTSHDYKPLVEINLKGVAVYAQAPEIEHGEVTLDSAALDVMTDFHNTPAITIGRSATADEANARMISFGIRSLLVTDAQKRIIGIITASDILGEKPMKVLQSRGGQHHEIEVQDIMTASDKLLFVRYADLKKAKVGHVLQTLKQSGRQHTLVLEETNEHVEVVRGIVSTAQIARQLREPVVYSDLAQTFGEIGKALV